MNAKFKKELDELVSESAHYSFENNKEPYHSTYSQASPPFLLWVDKVDNFIKKNYSGSTPPYQKLCSVKNEKFTGYLQSEFELELLHLKNALNSCSSIKPNLKRGVEKKINFVTLIKFVAYMLPFVGGAYTIGLEFGKTRFDKEKIELNNENESKTQIINELIHKCDSLSLLLNEKTLNEIKQSSQTK